jgi:DNA (cytosine-5)-methyltransferase 1
MLRVFEAFSGYGSQSMALKRLGIDFEVVAISEIDKYAIAAYEAIHSPTYNVGDISKVRLSQIPDHDLFTYSFPCQDISVAGKQGSLEKGSGTRSSLLWECDRIIRFKRPKYLLLENVKNLVGKKHKEHFDDWLKVLEGYGYKNYWQVLNAKDYGIPQNRERVFVVSILGDEDYEFPKKQELELRLKDVLEPVVDEKYYLSEEIQKRFVYKESENEVKRVGNTNPSGNGMNKNVFDVEGLSPTLTTNKGEGIRVIGNIPREILNDNERQRRIYGVEGLSPSVLARSDSAKILTEGYVDIKGASKQIRQVVNIDGICPTVDTMQGGHRQPKILEYPVIAASRGRNPENPSDRTVGAPTKQRLEINKKGISNTITTVQKDNYVLEANNTIIDDTQGFDGTRYYDGYSPSLRAQRSGLKTMDNDFRIRKLTPLECWSLMDVSPEDFWKVKNAGISDSQLYKLAGNSIVVNVLVEIFRNIFK